ncbi:MAG: hypothetical protein CVT95_10250, partial [Bacteroidetes bacterium HGW-Bacteroidetes-12]
MNRYNTLTLLMVYFFIVGIASTQTTTNSIYSKYGIGVIRPQSFSQNFAMGGVAMGLKSERNINILNPASLSAISLTTFEVGFNNNALWMNDGNQSQYKNNPYISSLAIAFPVINQKWGMSVGLMPATSVGYEYTDIFQDPIVGSVTSLNKGEGGLNKFYFGNGFSINIDSTSSIGVGVNGNFYFGKASYDQKMVFGNLANGLNMWDLNETTTADFGFDFGSQYQKAFVRKDSTGKEGKAYVFTLGGMISLAKSLNSRYNQLTRTFIGSADFGTIKDTIINIDNKKTTLEIPLEFGVGFSFEKPNVWLVALDYRTSDWSGISNSNPFFTYNKVQSFAAGFQFIPNYSNYTGSYFNRVVYRLGTRYSTSYISVNEVDLNEYGITFGLGLPLRRTGTSL